MHTNTFAEIHINTERVLAHELAHALGLCHPEEANCNQSDGGFRGLNFMPSNGSSANSRSLAAAQCEIVRNTYPHLFDSE